MPEPTAVEVPQPEVPQPEVKSGEEFVYEFQPADKQNRPLGGKQTIKAKDAQAALDVLAKNYTEAQRHIRELNQRAELSGGPDANIPANAERVKDEALDFKPRDLTADEKWTIQQDPSSPEARRAIIESTIGASPDKIRETLIATQSRVKKMSIAEHAQAFINATPDYYDCRENGETITAWLNKNNLEKTKTNFELAFRTLTDRAALLTPPPTVAEDDQANTQSGPATEVALPQESEQQRRPARASSGLNNSNARPGGGTPASRSITWADVDRMSDTEYMVRYKRDSAFRTAVNRLPAR